MHNTQPRERPSRVSWKDKPPAVFAIGGEKHWNCRKWREDVQNLSKHSCNSCQSSPRTRMQQPAGWGPRFCYRKVLTVTKTFQISLTTSIIKVTESRFELLHVNAGCNELSISETDEAVGKQLLTAAMECFRSIISKFWFNSARSLPVMNRCYTCAQRAKLKYLKNSSVYSEYMQNVCISDYCFWTHLCCDPWKMKQYPLQPFITVCILLTPLSLFDSFSDISYVVHTLLRKRIWIDPIYRI